MLTLAVNADLYYSKNTLAMVRTVLRSNGSVMTERFKIGMGYKVLDIKTLNLLRKSASFAQLKLCNTRR